MGLLIGTLYVRSNQILAKPEKTLQSSSKNRRGTLPDQEPASTKKLDGNSTSSLKPLELVENAEGLKAKAKPLILTKEAIFPDLAKAAGRDRLFSELVIPNTKQQASFDYVDENGSPIKPKSGTVGFYVVYVEISETNSDSSIRVPIPVTVVDETTTTLLEERVALQTEGTVENKVTLSLEEIAGKAPEEIKQLVNKRAKISAWETETGAEVPVAVSETTVEESVGTYQATFAVSVGEGDKQQTATMEKEIIVQKTTSEPVASLNSTRAHPTRETVEVDSKAGLSYNLPFLKVSELTGKTSVEIRNLLQERLALEAWRLSNRNPLIAKIRSSEVTSSSQGECVTDIEIDFSGQKLIHKVKVLVVPDTVFDKDSTVGWENIPGGAKDGFITNPVNGSKIGFLTRGLNDDMTLWGWSDIGFRVEDKAGKGYVYHAGRNRVTSIPGINNQVIYSKPDADAELPLGIWGRNRGLGRKDEEKKEITTKYFLRKDNRLKELLFDSKNQVLYVYDLGLSRNLNFIVRLDMYNLSSSVKSFAMLESVDTDYYTDNVPIYALENNGGFYLEQKGATEADNKRFSIRLKNAKGDWLSDYQKFYAGNYPSMKMFNGYNYFGNDFSKAGLENKKYNQGDVIINNADSAYALGAPWKDIKPNEALKTGYEVFAGNELPYMNLQLNPKIFNVYRDREGSFDVNYSLSQIPTKDGIGKIYAVYPNGEERSFPFVGDDEKTAAGKLTIPRDVLPNEMNGELGSVKTYSTNLVAVHENPKSPMDGLPSQDQAVVINVYNLGGKPIGQVVQKGSTWNKTAESLIKDPVVLPGHKAKFEYENSKNPVDTSKAGLQLIKVRMTDQNEPTQTVVMEVPVLVTEDKPPTTGLILEANDFSLSKKEVAGLDKAKIDALILKKSNPVTWDITTGLNDGIELSVKETTLTNNPDPLKNYTATLQAKKGSVIKTKKIQIYLSAKLTVEFVDEKGTSLETAYTDVREIGTSVDVSQITGVATILKKLKDNNYDLAQNPENETITIAVGENKVTYQFNGTLKLLSAPTVLDFEMKQATINAVRYKEPKIIGKSLVVSDTRAEKVKWNLKAKVNQPLTSLEDKQVKMPEAIKYQYQEEVLTLTDENTTIFSHLNTVSGRYDVTKERWAKGDGFMLDLAPGAVKALGKYQGKITITLENAK